MSKHECCLMIKVHSFKRTVKLYLDFTIVGKSGFRWDVPNINKDLRLQQHII